jgi:hypothetical protein
MPSHDEGPENLDELRSRTSREAVAKLLSKEEIDETDFYRLIEALGKVQYLTNVGIDLTREVVGIEAKYDRAQSAESAGLRLETCPSHQQRAEKVFADLEKITGYEFGNIGASDAQTQLAGYAHVKTPAEKGKEQGIAEVLVTLL